jgi:hypothetical protein
MPLCRTFYLGKMSIEGSDLEKRIEALENK